MTAKQFLAKYPDSNLNENCLEDMGCPNCGNWEQFSIRMTSIFEIVDEGTGDNEDTEWDGKSFCRCGDCDHEGRVKDFTFKGLDQMVYDKQNP